MTEAELKYYLYTKTYLQIIEDLKNRVYNNHTVDIPYVWIGNKCIIINPNATYNRLQIVIL